MTSASSCAATQTVDYGRVMVVMGLLASAGFTHIGLVTDVAKPKPDEQLSAAAPQRPPRPTTARGPRAGLVVSLLLHAALICGHLFTWIADGECRRKKAMPCRSIWSP